MTPGGVVTTIHSFDCGTEGCAPAAGLVQGTDGTASAGGPNGDGSVFRITTGGAVPTLHFFADCTSYFLRAGQALNETAGTSRKSVDVVVDSKEPCPTRTFKPFGTWSIVR
jgi:uncharacterized repeat protein (TIGR03803 family)